MGILDGAGRWYDGRVYAAVIDRLLAGVHGYVASHLPEGGRVLEAACGTGRLAQAIVRTGRTVVGVDLSPRHIEFARQRAEDAGFGPELRFEVGDLRELAVPEAGPYDLATIVLALHEMPRDVRVPVVEALSRAAEQVMIVDFAAPVAWNASGLMKRAAELAAGRDHHGAFRDYVAAGGLDAILPAAGVRTVTDRTIDSGTLRVVTVRDGRPGRSERGEATRCRTRPVPSPLARRVQSVVRDPGPSARCRQPRPLEVPGRRQEPPRSRPWPGDERRRAPPPPHTGGEIP